MAPRRSARAAPAKPEPVEPVETRPARALKKASGALASRPKKSDAPAVKPAAPAAPAAPTTAAAKKPVARKAAVHAPEPQPKRKKDEETALERKPKKARIAKVHEEEKEKPKGPVRRGGRKVIINEREYTKPLNVYVFGEGGSGELGLGASKKAVDVKRPRFNEALSKMDVVRLAAGGMHVVALTLDNHILTWGVNDNGALGRDTTNEDVKMKEIDENGSDSGSDSDSDSDSGLNEKEATPTAISMEHFPEDTVFVDVAAGDSCSFALTDEGAVYGWGTFRKNEGVLGFTKDVDTARTPIYLEGLKKIRKLVCGTNHVIALDSDHNVWAWGNGQQNQLGRRLTERTMHESLVPTHVGFGDKSDRSFKGASKKMETVACGDYHGMAIATDNHIWAWGANNYGETGFPDNAGSDNATVSPPRIIAVLEGLNIQSIACGSHHNVALSTNGNCYVWGRCDGSQTGIPLSQLTAIDDECIVKKQNNKPKILIQPTRLPSLSDVVMVACGSEHSIAITKSGKAYSWGFSANFQTGQGTLADIETPTLIDNTASKSAKYIWAGAGGQYSIMASIREPTMNGTSSKVPNGVLSA
ncbi:RCC1/BLIP-II [Lindgomyces ingoldianus]|uniref:RCC1/BLIP-II n=1 Tax=Lindgomyces ingoldianus TaxID=673940 RepID=A0ACB6R345_9PLEO|nr:RCC1/BLIP-II [Lindgomyces ingoldianus]KAF2473243.1 RCC1/BLIP-II [Lindgomyces ingoldianus]